MFLPLVPAVAVGILGLECSSAQCVDVGLRSPVPRGHVLGYIRARVLVIVPLRVCSRPRKTRRFCKGYVFCKRL